MSDQIIACPQCGKHINFSIVELTADQRVAFVQEREIEDEKDGNVHRTECPEGHPFWYATEEIDPLAA
jgi:hypothetical protein